METQTEWITLKEAAKKKYLGRSERWVQYLCQKGRIACEKRGRDWVIDKAAARTFKHGRRGQRRENGNATQS